MLTSQNQHVALKCSGRHNTPHINKLIKHIKQTHFAKTFKPMEYQHVHLPGWSRGPLQTIKKTPGAPLDPLPDTLREPSVFSVPPGSSLRSPRPPGDPPGSPDDLPKTPRVMPKAPRIPKETPESQRTPPRTRAPQGVLRARCRLS